jgi:hypothetical protein
MSWWSENVGDGNSFTESVANTFTPDDGASYVNGTLTYDSGDKAGQVVEENSSGGYGGNDDDGPEYSGTMNSINTNSDNISGNSNDDFTPSGMAPSGLKAALGYVSPIGIIGKLSGWANNLDPSKDSTKVVGGQQVYTNADGMDYSYNFLGLPYEVVVQGDTVVDKLSIKDKKTKLTGYETLAAQATALGNDDEAAAIMQEAEDNAQAAEGAASTGPLSADGIAKMIVDSGVAASNEEIQAMLADPKAFLDAKGINLSDIIPNLDPATEGALLDPTNPNYALSALEAYLPEKVTDVTEVSAVTKEGPVSYDVATASDRMDDPEFNVDPVTGEIRDENLVDANDIQIDMQGAATGVNADGTTNLTGEALNDYATQNITSIIDTSTVSGKLLAQKLGEGNYTDSKATIIGQMDIISAEFKDSNGEPKIPAWAQGVARNVQKTIAFSGMTGTAATAAMANAIMEATLGIAEKEAIFFQTLTTKNLDNRQQAIINKANVLSQFEVSNLGARQAAAVQNAKAFLQMDLTNLTNEQQAEVINTQSRVQALLDDTKEENASRRFTAESENDFTKFYTELGTQIEQFNATLLSDIKKFNAGEVNDATEFSLSLENNRQQFYSNMQYAVDEANARWRQTVATTNTQMSYDAAAADIKNILDISQEGLNRTWDRTDAALDYLFKGTVSEEEFDIRLLLGEMAALASTPQKASLFDTLLGGIVKISAASAGAGKNPLDWISSDARLKENIQPYDTLNGVQFYTWDWNDTAKKIGYDKYPTMGVIAQEVQKTHPDTVIEGPEGYLMVNYGKLKNEI